MTPLLLCSASPRRRELLAALGVRLEVISPDVDEAPRAGERAAALAERLARDKAQAGLALFRERGGRGPRVALAADTVVARGAAVLGKPRDRCDAARMLAQLSGGEHEVTTGVCVVSAAGALRSCAVETRVRFRALDAAQLRFLVDSGEGDDKAGAYALQGLAGAFVERIEGSVSGVVGLPLAESLELLAWAGFPLPWLPRPPSTGGAL